MGAHPECDLRAVNSSGELIDEELIWEEGLWIRWNLADGVAFSQWQDIRPVLTPQQWENVTTGLQTTHQLLLETKAIADELRARSVRVRNDDAPGTDGLPGDPHERFSDQQKRYGRRSIAAAQGIFWKLDGVTDAASQEGWYGKLILHAGDAVALTPDVGGAAFALCRAQDSPHAVLTVTGEDLSVALTGSQAVKFEYFAERWWFTRLNV